MTNPVTKNASYILVHTPDILKVYGSTQIGERASNPGSEYLKNINNSLRSFDEVIAYAPNQCYIGNMAPDDLKNIAQPWHQKENFVKAERFGKMGEIMPQDEFYALMKHVDIFDLVELTPEFIEAVKPKVEAHRVLSKLNIDLGSGVNADEMKPLIDNHKACGIYDNDKLVGMVKQAHDSDENLSAHIMLENIVVKASGVLSLLNLESTQGVDLSQVDYIIECSEEACGDINQRGGGNFAKAIGEMCNCVNATGSDTRSFCAAPAHAMVLAASLVKAGTYKNVAVVAGGAVSKLGMNGRDHYKKNVPLLEDCLGGFAVLVSENDGKSPIIRTDIVGRHRIGTGSSPQQVTGALIADPLFANGLSFTDIDKYSAELHNHEITSPAGAGNVPEANYKMIGALAVMKKQLERKDLPSFVEKHGMPGFVVTQGHIPSGVPFVGHAIRMMKNNEINRAMIVGKGSLFLGRMTNLFDGVSFVIEKNDGKEEAGAGFDENKVREMIAESMKTMAENLLKG